MTSVAKLVLATVNAPYGVSVSAHQLAAMLVDPASAGAFNASVFAFLSEVAPDLQEQFLSDMAIDKKKVGIVASLYEEASGYDLPLAA